MQDKRPELRAASWQKSLIQMTALVTMCVTYVGTQGNDFVPFVIPHQVNPDSAIAYEAEPIAQSHRLIARDHFYREGDGRRIRIWGVNFSFSANFPTHADAKVIARRLAAAGMNSVRLHHLDTANWPRGLWDPQSPGTFHPEALDRLDYFIDRLARHGIYTNLNLHVGRSHHRLLNLPAAPEKYDKIVSLFTPPLIEAQKVFAHNLLTRYNPYRQQVYAKDPAIAFVEITNENSLFMWSAPRQLANLPTYYHDLLQDRYNNWLKARYGRESALLSYWHADSEPLGPNLIKNPGLEIEQNGSYDWIVERHNGAKAKWANVDYHTERTLRLTPHKLGTEDWHLQMNRRALELQANRPYTVSFRAAAPDARPLRIMVGQAHAPWKNLGLDLEIPLIGQMTTYRLAFHCTGTDNNARLNFQFGQSLKPVYLTEVRFSSGAQYALEAGESWHDDSIKLNPISPSSRRRNDRLAFLAETEKSFFDHMRQYIKQDLSYTGLVTGTIVFGPLGLYAQSDMDYIDAHAYWQHPRFPGTPWDMDNWQVRQRAMTDDPVQSSLRFLAAQRLHGKPFTVSEYNHSAPNDYQAECVPLIATFGASQDWDGIWLYTYSHSNREWDRDRIAGFFDLDSNPAKWGFVPSGTRLFRDQRFPANDADILHTLGHRTDLPGSLIEPHIRHPLNIADTLNMFLPGEHFNEALNQRHATWPGPRPAEKSPAPYTRLKWDVNNRGRGVFFARDEQAMVMTGWTERFASHTANRIQIDAPPFAALTILSLDDQPLEVSREILITACGRAENQQMGFSQDRSTVGRNWGRGPVGIEALKGRIHLPGKPFKAMVLKPDGTVASMPQIDTDTLVLDPEHGTMWYLLQR